MSQLASTAVDGPGVERMFQLIDRVAIVTGGTRGMGRAVATGFVAAGAKVVVASRKPEAVLEAERELRERGAEVLGVVAHMGDLDQVQDLVDRTADRFGGIDIVINNAANPLSLPIGQHTPEAWAKSYDVNLRGPVFLVEAALPHLRRSSHGVVVNVLSAGAFAYSPDTAMYCAAKAAMVSWTRSMAAALAPGIRVNALAPGVVLTDMILRTDPEYRERMENAALMRRGAQPEEMVGPALFLASDASSFMTGQVLIVDGGLTPASPVS
ncbi:glucose 1-dehydrogenase [Streptomyces sp. NPDC051572]|uniref:SDR family NAD(P)-dependent oxidoreductase n=1 Tax=unclassified Streptomyces TaxID=2593676 RepID=UPI00344D3B82